MRLFLSFILICALSVSFNSCNLDILPEDEIAGEDAIDNLATARDALNSAYVSFPKNNITFSILAEDFFPTYLISRDANSNRLYMWDAQNIKIESQNMWRQYYETIKNINTLLISEKYIKKNTEKEEQQWNKIKGEAYALKALCYFELLNIYSSIGNNTIPGIILKDKVELEYLARSSTEDCLKEINRLLGESSSILRAYAPDEQKPKDGDQYYIGYYAVTLLRARVALYEQKYSEAKEYCETIISEIGYKNTKADAVGYRDFWTNKITSEKLFAFDNQIFILTQQNASETLGDYFAIPSIFNYEDDDVRKQVASIEFEMKANGVSELVKRYLIGKYRNSITDKTPKNINYLRLPEAYFILSECYLQLNDLGTAISTLNIFLSVRGATTVPNNLTESIFKDRLFLEKQREFQGEGLNFFELKRLKKDIKRYNVDSETVQSTINKTDFRMLFPIPFGELKNNNKMVQNSGWENIVN